MPNFVKVALAENYLKTCLMHEKVLQHTDESAENKTNRLIGTLENLIRILE